MARIKNGSRRVSRKRPRSGDLIALALEGKYPGPCSPVLEYKGEVVAYFASLERGVVQEIRKVLDEILPDEEWARTESPWGSQLFRINFCGGDWQGEDARDVPTVLRGGVTLEFWPDGVALRFAPYFAKPLEGVDDGEV